MIDEDYDLSKMPDDYFDDCKTFEDRYMRVETAKAVQLTNKLIVDLEIGRNITQRLNFILFLLILILLVLFSPVDGFGEEAVKLSEKDIEIYRYQATELAKCQGVFQANSEFLYQSGYPKNAENTKGLSNGAAMASMYIFGLLKRIKEPGVEFKYGIFLDYINSIAHGERTQVSSLLELGQLKDVQPYLMKCRALNYLQTEMIKLFRKEMYPLP